jgi:hypothetical protein
VTLSLEEHNAKVKALHEAYERMVDAYNEKAAEHHRAQKEADVAFDGMEAAYRAWMDAFRARSDATDAHFAQIRGHD